MDTTKPLPLWKILITLLTFFLCITSIRIVWMNMNKPPESVIAEDGQVDLSSWEFSNNKTISLEGEWGFFPNEFVNPESSSTHTYTTSIYGEEQDPFATNQIVDEGYASYELEIITPEESQQYGIRFNEINTAAKVFVNGDLIAKKGAVSESFEDHTGQLGTITSYFNPDEGNINLIIHASKHDFPSINNFTNKITFGTNEAISAETATANSLQLILCIILLLHSFFAFSLYLFGIRRKQLLYFGMLVLITGLSSAIDDGRVLSYWITLDPVWTTKTLYITFFISTVFSLMFVNSIETLHKKVFYTLISLYVTLSLVIIVMPVSIAQEILPIGLLLNIFGHLYMFGYFLSKIKKTSFDRIFILLAMVAVSSNILWGTAINLDLVEITYYPFDLIISIIAFSLYLFMHYNQLSRQNEDKAIKLLEMDKNRDEFLVNTSHEIRNPLHGIINIAQSLLDSNELSKESQENTKLLINIGKKMGYTLNDLSVVTQLRENQVTLQKRHVNLHMTASVVLNMLEFMKEGKNISLQSTIPVDFPPLQADENRLIQILFNLVHNAIKFTEEGSVSIGANYKNEMATIYVKDTGIGIPPDHNIGRIFQAYERGNEQRHNVSGIGIGLSVSKQLVELHGGSISYESAGKGTTFVFTIPLAINKEAVPALAERIKSEKQVVATTTTKRLVENKAYMNQGKAQILIVDDDPINVKVLQQVLASDYHVLSALSGKEALQKIEQNRFDLVISDVMMPYMSGYEFTKKVREKYTISELPILLVTARNFPEDIHTAFEAGANDYLTKPVHTAELKTRVDALTSLKQSVKELLRFEAAWLQAQIHPHFLFNTLNSIVSLAETDTDRMITLIEAFGDYLQKSFSLTNVESEVSLRDELELTQAYVHIEKERFGERVCVQFDVEMSKDILVPPLSIQPLVENAIMHGILANVEGGTVTIQMRESDDFIEFVITDDGVGMSEKKVKDLLILRHEINDGIGIKNTNRRLTQLYGKGLEISSEVGKGTVVSFKLPRNKK